MDSQGRTLEGVALLNAFPIRVMSFNVRGTLRDMRKKDVWRNRAALNVATMERCVLDVIGLQECQRGNLKAYLKTLPRYTPAYAVPGMSTPSTASSTRSSTTPGGWSS